MDELTTQDVLDSKTDIPLWVDEQLQSLGFAVPSHKPLRQRLLDMDVRPVLNLIAELNKMEPDAPRAAAFRRNLAELLEVHDTRIRPTPEPTHGESVKAFSRTAAVQFQAAQSSDQAKTPTIRIEVAPMNQEGQGAQWDEKLVVQVSRKDLPLIAAVVLGELPELKADYYGEQRNKSIYMRNQGGHLLVALSGPGTRHQGSVGPSDRFWAAGLVLRQLHQANPGLDGTSLRYLIRQAAYLHTQGKGSQQNGKGHPTQPAEQHR